MDFQKYRIITQRPLLPPASGSNLCAYPLPSPAMRVELLVIALLSIWLGGLAGVTLGMLTTQMQAVRRVNS